MQSKLYNPTIKRSLTNWFIILINLLFLSSCANDETPPVVPPDPSPVEGIMKMEEVLNGTDLELLELVDRVRGSIGKNSVGSFTILSTQNTYELALIVTPNHVLGSQWWGDLHIDIPEIFLNPKELTPVGRINLIPPTGEIAFKHISPLFAFYTPEIPAFENQQGLRNILPKHDFSLGMVDNQREEIDNLVAPAFMDMNTNDPIQLYDPHNRTKTNTSWGQVLGNENVFSIGYPQDEQNFPNGAVAIGRICLDNEAEEVIALLKNAGDEEGEIPYNKEVEMIMVLRGIAGMSGGGVFNDQGQLVGMLVRATELNGQYYTRAVRISYIQRMVNSGLEKLSTEQQDVLKPFLGNFIME